MQAAHRSERSWGSLGLVALLLCLLLAGSRLNGRAAETLVDLDPTQLERIDGNGLSWDPQVDGMLRDGSNDCFDGALELKVNGSTFSPTISRKMTPDASELILQGKLGGLEVTRRVRFDMELGAARYVEIIRNTTRQVVPVKVELTSALGAKASEIVSNTDDAMSGGMLESGEYGFVADHGGGTRPAAVFVLSTPGSPTEPTIQIYDQRRFVCTWNLKLTAGRTVALLHTIAQRRWRSRPQGDALEAVFAPFLQGRWAMGLPPTVHRALLNFRGSVDGSTRLDLASSDGMIRALAKYHNVQRGEDTILLIEPGTALEGALVQVADTGQEIEVQTAQGAARLTLDEVAVLVGGGNRGRDMRVYLRNGEVLVGSVEAPELKFKSRSGLTISIDPAGVEILFLPSHESDGVVPEGAQAYLSLVGGSRLALGKGTGLVLPVATAWGELRIPLARVVELRRVREPRPTLLARLDDGSKFPLALTGAPLRVESLRFGSITVEPGTLSAWRRLGASVPLLARYGKSVGPERSHACLPGKTYLVGELELDTIHVRTDAKATPLSVATLRQVERGSGDMGDGGWFVWSLRNGQTLHGQIQERLLPLRTPFGLCHVPTRYLVGLRIGTIVESGDAIGADKVAPDKGGPDKPGEGTGPDEEDD